MSYTRYSRSPDGGEQFVLAILAGVTTVLLVSALLTIWLIVQVTNLLLNAFAHHPKHPALWISLLSSLAFSAATGILLASEATTATSGQIIIGVLGGLALLATLALLVIARVLEIIRSDLLLLDRGKTTVVDKVLRQPWWSKEGE